MTMHWFNFPKLDVDAIAATREALHAYSQILGAWIKVSRSRRKHWWHVSLQPSLNGLTSGVVYAGAVSFELELNLRASCLAARCSNGQALDIVLHGQAAAELAAALRTFLLAAGVPAASTPAANTDTRTHAGYSIVEAQRLGRALAATSAVMTEMRAGIREETSPLGLWPHHFDLALLWLPGNKIPDEDPDDEENADVQMNFGFTFGDDLVAEPYFYATVYPLPAGFPSTDLAAGAEWFSDGFSGMVWRYARLLEQDRPEAALMSQWRALLDESRQSLDIK